MKGKSEAWGSFAEVLREEMEKAGVGKGEGVKEGMEEGMEEEEREDVKRGNSVVVKEEVKMEEG